MGTREKIEAYAAERLGEQSPGLTHTYRVYRTARLLSNSFDDELLHASCMLHDINMDRPHPRKAAEEAEAFLVGIGFPKEKTGAVIHAIQEHGYYGNPDSKEGFMLFDADQLDSMGITGLIQFGQAYHDHAELDRVMGQVEMEGTSILRLARSKEIARQKSEERNLAISLLNRLSGGASPYKDLVCGTPASDNTLLPQSRK